MPGYIIYIDTLMLQLAANFLFEFLLLWATAEVTKSSTTRLRLGFGAFIGTIHYLVFLLSSYRIIPHYGLLRFFPVLVAVSLLMIFATFYPKTKGKQLLKILGYFYGIGFISAGAGMAAGYFFGSPTQPQSTVAMLVSIATILIIAELGWGILQKKIYRHVYQIPIKIGLDNQFVELTALIDTGNKLKDPLTKQSVIVVEQQALTNLFKPEILKLFQDASDGNLDVLTEQSSNLDVAVRIRVIPFNTIGKSQGMLIGFRPDFVEIKSNKQEQIINNVIIAVYHQNLDPERDYQALIPPELLNFQDQSLQNRPLQGGEPNHATSTQSKL